MAAQKYCNQCHCVKRFFFDFFHVPAGVFDFASLRTPSNPKIGNPAQPGTRVLPRSTLPKSSETPSPAVPRHGTAVARKRRRSLGMVFIGLIPSLARFEIETARDRPTARGLSMASRYARFGSEFIGRRFGNPLTILFGRALDRNGFRVPGPHPQVAERCVR